MIRPDWGFLKGFDSARRERPSQSWHTRPHSFSPGQIITNIIIAVTIVITLPWNSSQQLFWVVVCAFVAMGQATYPILPIIRLTNIFQICPKGGGGVQSIFLLTHHFGDFWCDCRNSFTMFTRLLPHPIVSGAHFRLAEKLADFVFFWILTRLEVYPIRHNTPPGAEFEIWPLKSATEMTYFGNKSKSLSFASPNLKFISEVGYLRSRLWAKFEILLPAEASFHHNSSF